MKDDLKALAALLGAVAAKAASLAALGLDALRKRTRDQLREAAKKLDLTGVSKLRKDQLAERVLEALRARFGRARASRSSEPDGASRVDESAQALAHLATAKSDSTGAGRAAGGNLSRGISPIAAEGAQTTDEERARKAKLSLGAAPVFEKPVEHIPWSYGVDRVTVSAVDPDRLYVYWEVSDGAIERARSGLGPGGRDAWLNLRAYDTTGLIFDGTNAHGYFDHRVERWDRQWFFGIGRPSSAAVVEIGMKSAEGFFVKIARSGRVDFPRKEAAPWSKPEWLTVFTARGEVMHAGAGVPSRAASAPEDRGEAPSSFTPIPIWALRESEAGQDLRARELLERAWEHVEWREERGDGWFELVGRVEWLEPLSISTWEAGPFTYPVEIRPPLRQEWQGRSFAYTVGGVTHVAYGPWQVVIRNLGAHREHAVLGRWEVYRSWVAEGGRELRLGDGQGPVLRAGASELLALGGSERRWAAGSELRLGGASEIWRLGASELRFRGASEILFAGASQWMLRGASERRFPGASEKRLGGASELRLAGGSEERLGGASERRLGGSEPRLQAGPEIAPPQSPAAGLYPKIAE